MYQVLCTCVGQTMLGGGEAGGNWQIGKWSGKSHANNYEGLSAKVT